MKLEEAVKELEDIRDFDLAEDATGREAIQEAIKAVQKQIPKKPEYDGDYRCPCCYTAVEYEAKCLSQYSSSGIVRDMYCSECGQAIDWSGEHDN